MRALPVVVALVFVLSPLATGAGAIAPDQASRSAVVDQASRPVVGSINGTTSYLAIPDDQVRSTERTTVEFGISGSVAIGAERLKGGSENGTFFVRYENANNRRQVVEDELNDLGNATQELRARQVQITRQYNAGELTARQYLVELAVITARAQSYSELVRALDRNAPPSLGPTARRLGYEFDAFSGPVRMRLLAAVRGEIGAPQRFYVETSSNGVVVATIDDGRYFREAYLNSARTGPGSWTEFSQAQDAFSNAFYPWASNKGGAIGINAYGDIYRFTSGHPHGNVFSFADADSGQVFAEFQTKVLADAPVEPAGTNQTDAVALDVALTHRGGQLRVRATDPDTDAPLDQPVYVNGEFVGRTGQDGTMYALTPRGRVNTTAVVDGDPVVVITGDTGSTAGGG